MSTEKIDNLSTCVICEATREPHRMLPCGYGRLVFSGDAPKRSFYVEVLVRAKHLVPEDFTPTFAVCPKHTGEKPLRKLCHDLLRAAAALPEVQP